MTTQQLHITILIFLSTIFSLKVIGQTTPDNKLHNDSSCLLKFDSVLNRNYYLTADIMPSYRGGQDTLVKIIRKNLRWAGGECCMEGTIYVTFIIDTDGKVTSKRILHSFMTNEDNICNINKEALNVVDYLTDWTVGQCNGKNVAVQLVLPIKFSLKR